ncbi:MAG TPA: hypothetical protein VGD80_30475 [Kofleriaceae bacterium]
MSRVFLALAALVATVSAEPAPREPSDTGDAPARHPRRHAIYVELLGRAGLWGIGYDFQPRRWLAIGAAASYYALDGDRFSTIAPYAALYPVSHGGHAAFVQLGPSLVRRTTPSPVPEWDGMSTTRLGAELCAGYEYRRSVLFRAYAMASQGDHLVPWLGVSLGWTL